MQPPQPSALNSNPPHAPRLPDDIVYSIAMLSCFKTRASLVQCSKQFRATCMLLLFRDIYIHTPTKLVQLCENTRFGLLGETKTLFLGQALFYQDTSEAFQHSSFKSRYVISILKTTKSLLRLQIIPFDSHMNSFGMVQDRLLLERLRRLSTDPAFLPSLEIIAGARGLSLDFLRNLRSVKYLSDITIIEMSVELYLKRDKVASAPPLGPANRLSPREIGSLINETKGNFYSCTLPPSFRLIMRTSGESNSQQEPTITDLPAWTREMVMASNLASDYLSLLSLTFDPSPPFMPAREQFKLVEELCRIIPSLEITTVAYPAISWHRTTRMAPMARIEFYGSEILPRWTPRPNANQTDPEVIEWWLDLLVLNGPDTPGYDHWKANENARRLRDAMHLQWEDRAIPDESWLGNYLRGGRD